MLLPINCYANVAPLYGHGEVMGGKLTDLTELFLLLFKCKQIKMIYDYLTPVINSVK